MKTFWKNLFPSIINSFRGINLLFHISAVALTYLIVTADLDWQYFVTTRTSEAVNAFFFPAIIIGMFLPIIVPLLYIIFGTLLKDRKRRMFGWMLGQAALAGWLISSTYKAFTGRIQPNLHDVVNDISHGFQFGFWEHGIFWGWPSSHTTVAFAMAYAVIVNFPKHLWLRRIVLIYAFYIGLGVSLSIHWFSEFAAGALIGAAIGMAVGEVWKERI